MKITWLGQAGLMFETGDTKIICDPYLSNSVVKVNPKNERRYPVDERFLKIKPDVLLLTHDHLDHTDPETLPHYLNNDGSILVLAPKNAWKLAKKFGGNHNYVMFNRHTMFSHNGIRFRAVKAEHSDLSAIGFIIEAEGRTYYITGDTLYNEEIFADLPQNIDVMFLPINGVGNNMNSTDAALFAKRVNPKIAVPLHWGLFDSIDPRCFTFENRVIPKAYEEIPL